MNYCQALKHFKAGKSTAQMAYRQRLFNILEWKQKSGH